MFRTFRIAFLLFISLSLLTGILYPMIMTGIGQTAFSYKADGSLIEHNGVILGSKLIGQNFTEARYFHGRPNGNPHRAQSNAALVDEVKKRIAVLQAENPKAEVPMDLATDSASGVDPHISPEAALFQIPRIAKARHIDAQAIETLVNKHIEHPTLGIFGEPRVNVLLVNLALDKDYPIDRK